MMATLEHTNFTVRDPQASAAWMQKVFGWKTRWEGPAIAGGYTVHVGSAAYLSGALCAQRSETAGESSYDIVGGLNHVGVLVEDIDATEESARGRVHPQITTPITNRADGFTFDDDNGIEFEVVQYD